MKKRNNNEGDVHVQGCVKRMIINIGEREGEEEEKSEAKDEGGGGEKENEEIEQQQRGCIGKC